MEQLQLVNTKRVRQQKGGPVLQTPAHASWDPRSMTTSSRRENSSDAIVCPVCGKVSSTHKAYSIHYGKKQDDAHSGNPSIARFGEERLIELYWEYDYEEIADMLGIGSTTVFNVYDDLDLPKKTKYNEVAWEHGVSKERLAYHLHIDAQMTTTEMANALGVSRPVVDKLFEKTDINSRSQGEAAQLALDEMSESKRQKMTQAAREKQKEKYGDGGAIGQWVRENPEKHAEIARENAHKGTPAREENGMAGVTGQDNPRWRGGKSIYDAVKKQLPGESWRQKKVEAKKRDDNTCQMCGATDCKLDSHHIVPIMAGGTNEFWNLITLCESCHREVEAYTRDLPGMQPVLTE